MIKIALILSFLSSCIQKDLNQKFKFQDLVFDCDSILIEESVLRNRIEAEKLHSDSVFLQSDPALSANYYLLDSTQYKGLYYQVILALRNHPDVDLETYMCLYLKITDHSHNTIGVLKIAEKYDLMLITELSSNMTSHFLNDSILITYKKSRICTDILPIQCWDVSENTSWKVDHNGVQIIDTEVIRELLSNTAPNTS